MLTARMHQAKNVVLVERAQMDEIQAELALSNSNQVNQGTKVKTGRLSAADMILMGRHHHLWTGRQDREKQIVQLRNHVGDRQVRIWQEEPKTGSTL